MNIGYITKIIEVLIASIYLIYILIVAKNFLTRIIVILFLMFGISLLIKNICLMLKKKKLAIIFSKINIIAFFIYYFGFLIYWDYLAIKNKEYILIIFSLLAWIGGIFVVYRKYLKLRNNDKI